MGKGEWKKVRSDDKELRRYLVSGMSLANYTWLLHTSQRWRWAVEEFKEWNEETGVVGPITPDYLERLPHTLAQ